MLTVYEKSNVCLSIIGQTITNYSIIELLNTDRNLMKMENESLGLIVVICQCR